MKHLTFSFLFRLIVLALFGVVLAKEVFLIFQTRSEAIALTVEASTRAGTDSRTQILRSLRASAADDILRLDRAAVTKSGLVNVISMIEDTGKSLGLVITISSISGGTSSASNTPMTVRIAVETSGPWSPNLSFSHLLENLPYKVSVDESKLTRTEKTWQGHYVLSLTTLP